MIGGQQQTWATRETLERRSLGCLLSKGGMMEIVNEKYGRMVDREGVKARAGITADSTLWRWEQNGKLTAYRFLGSHKVWYRVNELNALLQPVQPTLPTGPAKATAKRTAA